MNKFEKLHEIFAQKGIRAEGASCKVHVWTNNCLNPDFSDQLVNLAKEIANDIDDAELYTGWLEYGQFYVAFESDEDRNSFLQSLNDRIDQVEAAQAENKNFGVFIFDR